MITVTPDAKCAIASRKAAASIAGSLWASVTAPAAIYFASRNRSQSAVKRAW